MRIRPTIAAGVAITMLAIATVSAGSASGAPSEPGVTVEQITGSLPAMVQVPTGSALIAGVGGPANAVSITSTDEIPSVLPGASESLRTAVEQFLIQCAGVAPSPPQDVACDAPAYVIGASAASGSAIAAAFGGDLPVGPDLYVAADLGSLDGADWMLAATAMSRAAAGTRSVAVLDAPQTLIVAAKADPESIAGVTSLASQLRVTLGDSASAAFLLGSGLIVDDVTIGAAASYAGVIALSDQEDGFWNASANHAFVDADPQWSATMQEAGSMSMAGVAPLTYWPGRGAVVRSERTVAATTSTYLNVVRTVDTIESTITSNLSRYVFEPNDATTWSSISSDISAYLTDLWQQGALHGANAAAAFSVHCGLGSTMTAQDILNGYLIYDVTIGLVGPGIVENWSSTIQLSTS